MKIIAKKSRKNFSPEFRLETAQLVVEHGYIHEEAAKAMNVGFSTIGKWVKQLKEERQGKDPKHQQERLHRTLRWVATQGI